MYENTPRMKPYMITVSTPDGQVVSHMMAAVRYRASLLPPFLYTHCLVLGEGEYEESEYSKEELFGKMLHSLTRKIQYKVLYVEFSHLSNKMFGYRRFRRCGYFPVHWLNIHNSLHSKSPENRLGDRMARRIRRAYDKGVVTEEIKQEEELHYFSHLLRKHNRLKPKRYIPDDTFFRMMMTTDNGKLFVTKYKNKVIGCCACAYSGNNAFLWYSAFLRKTFAMLHPDILTIWHAIKQAYNSGYDHIFFMDVGLPFQKNPYREFILQFGGKPVSTYRWFRFSTRWINRLLSWIYRD